MLFKKILRIFGIIILFLSTFIRSITNYERSELARKFKYYYKSIRPTENFNLIETINGTYFCLNSEMEILQTTQDQIDIEKLHLELMLIVHYNDDRLILRELNGVVNIPSEFQAWQPSIDIVESLIGARATEANSGGFSSDRLITAKKSLNLDPKTGQITIFQRIYGIAHCRTSVWKRPFHSFFCELRFNTDPDERIFLRIVRDLRPKMESQNIAYSFEEWPNVRLRFSYASAWLTPILNIYLPSILCFGISIFAQFKRRKIQVFVTLTSIICIIIIHTSRQYNIGIQSSITLQDLWLSIILVHLFCILSADLLLPARRIVFSTFNLDTLQKENEKNKKEYSKRRTIISSKKLPKYAKYQQIFYPNYSPLNTRQQINLIQNPLLNSSKSYPQLPVISTNNNNNIRQMKFEQIPADLLNVNKSVKFNSAFENADEENCLDILDESIKSINESHPHEYFRKNEGFLTTTPFADNKFNIYERLRHQHQQQQQKITNSSPLKSSTIIGSAERITLNLKDSGESTEKPPYKKFQSNSKFYTNPLDSIQKLKNFPLLRQISNGIGHKKRRALIAILVSFCHFLILYILLTFYAIFS